jgi:inner centromere protein
MDVSTKVKAAPQSAPGSGSSSSSFNLKQKKQRPPPTAVNSPNRSSQKEHRELVIERKEAQKESRTLRRHVVSLNEQLEAAESELQAQRKELERAAERMEKDRVRQKQEKDKTQKTQVQETTLLKTQHEKSLKEQQTRYEEQLEKYRKKLSEEEKKRKKEGGTWDKEMSNATEREHEMREAVGAMEDEKSTLIQQISTLQGQQTALGLRLESLTQASDNSMERERDAEDRLDAALNQHARQISQRQVRVYKYNIIGRKCFVCE